MYIKPIETYYKGYRFRSRTEARWAVFFDALGWKWEYEKEGYEAEDGTRYLPDFWFPDFKTFAEIKGKEFTEEENQKCNMLIYAGFGMLQLVGPPEPDVYWYSCKCGEDNEAGTSMVVFVPNGHKHYPFFYTDYFDIKYFSDTFDAVAEARSARFEFNR